MSKEDFLSNQKDCVPVGYLIGTFENNFLIIKDLLASSECTNKIKSPYDIRIRTLLYLIIRKIAIKFHLNKFFQYRKIIMVIKKKIASDL